MKQLNNIEEIESAMNQGNKVVLAPTRQGLHVTGGCPANITSIIKNHPSGSPLLCTDGEEDWFYSEGDDIESHG